MKQIPARGAALAALVLLMVGAAAAAAPLNTSEVMKIDEAYRVAKLNRDISALNRLLADGFNETNQNGNSRNKAQTIELWKSFSIHSLTTDTFQVQISGDTATVTGTQTEDGTDRMLFTRVYVNGSGGLQLLASTQFRDPRLESNAGSAPRMSAAEAEVWRADEAYRVAKLNRDTTALNQLLADAFYETNQNGNSRDKTQTIELWRTFSINALTTDSFQVRLAGDTATVTGTQTENKTERMLFTRVYVKGSGGWRVLSSMQFRDPNPTRNLTGALR